MQTWVGGFAIHYSFAAFNSFKTGTQTIAVPHPKSELTIETKTFRDKLEPGTDETWSFNIKGPQGDKVSAELLASMYDMSLDQFQPHEWQFSPLNLIIIVPTKDVPSRVLEAIVFMCTYRPVI